MKKSPHCRSKLHVTWQIPQAKQPERAADM
jgi:hypothetical protein